MKPQRKKVLYIHHTSVVGGASWSLYQIIASIRTDYDVVVVLAEEGPLRARLREELGVRVILDRRIKGFTTIFGGSKSLLRRVNLVGLLSWRGTVAAVREICRRERPDIVHLNTFVLFNCALGCKQAGVPRVVLHVREPLLFPPGGWRERLMLRTVAANVDAVLSISRANAQEPGVPDRTVLVPNWPDFTGREGPVDLERDYGIAPDRKLILALGERLRHKGSLTAIQAMSRVRDPQALLVVLGGRPTGGALKRFIRVALDLLGVRTYGLRMDREAAGAPERVRLAGVSLNVRSLIERASVVVCPFVRPHFAKATIEAAAMGKPCIVTAGAPQDESVVHGQTGLIVPPQDARALAEAINRLLDDPDLAGRLGEEARTFVSQHYNRQKSLELIRKVYES